MYFLYVWIGVLAWCAVCVGSIIMCYVAAGFLFAVLVDYSVRIYGLVHVFGNITGPATGQVHKLLMCSWSVPFPLLWFSGGCVFSSCWLRFDVALCYRGLSPCVLICNLRA